MFVDDRLREGLERSAAGFVPDASRGLDVVVRSARRRRTGRRVVAGTVLVLALASGVGAVLDRGPDATAPAVPAAPAPTADGTGRPESDDLLASRLVGEWTTAVVSPEEAAAAMARTGTLGHRDAVLRELPVPGTFALTFDVVTYQARLDGQEVDVGRWSVQNGRLVLTPSCGWCRIVLWPEVDAGVLRLALVEDGSPEVRGVPSAAHASVIYTSAPFRRP